MSRHPAHEEREQEQQATFMSEKLLDFIKYENVPNMVFPYCQTDEVAKRYEIYRKGISRSEHTLSGDQADGLYTMEV